MIRALLHLRWCSARNRIRTRLRRLREPKYLIGAIVGMAYFYGVFFRHLGSRGSPWSGLGEGGVEGGAAGVLALIELGGAWLLLLLLAGLWIVPSRRAAIEFSEAEIQFLFPAPVSRRGLLHYKLLSWQFGLLFTALVVGLFTGRIFRPGGAVMAVVGGWLALLLVQLHALGASFARTRLFERGFRHWQRRMAFGGLGLLLVAGTLVWGWQTWPTLPPLDAWDAEALREWFERVSATAPMAWALEPARWVSRLVTTRDSATFLAALVPVSALVVVHYFWVVRSSVAFEEASVEAAREAADRLSAVKAGRGASATRRSRGNRRRAIWEPGPVGVPWLALGWKNVIAAGDLFRGRMLVALAVALLPALLVAAINFRQASWAVVVGGLAAMLLAMSVLIGPAMVRFDLRQDLVGAGDLLKALPLSGWQVVLGELMAPWFVLTLVQAGLATVAAIFMPLPGDWRAAEALGRAGLGLGAMMLAPALSLVGLMLHNAAALLFPAWVLVQPGQGRGGFEAMGQQMIVFGAQMLAFLALAGPAIVVGVAAFAIGAWATGPWLAAPGGALVAAVVLGIECAFGVYALGRAWDRTDVSRERLS